MAFSKTFLLLGLAFAVALLISSEVSARDELAESTQTHSAETNMEETNYGTDFYGYGYGHRYKHSYGHGQGHGHGYSFRKGHGHHGKSGHGGHPGHGPDEVETEGGEN